MHTSRAQGLLILVFSLLFCSLLPLVFTDDRGPTYSTASLVNSFGKYVSKVKARPYGSGATPDLPEQIMQVLSDNKTRESFPDPRNGSCHLMISVADGSYYDFIVKETTKHCVVIVKPDNPDSVVMIDTTDLDLGPCSHEYLHLTQANYIKSTVCGQPTPLTVSGARYLSLQYERRVPTQTAFTLRVWAGEPPSDRTARDVSAEEEGSGEDLEEQIQICPEVCGQPPMAGRTGRILGGTPAEPGEFPWMVQVHSASVGPKGVPPNYTICGGSILDRKHILTSAHCIINLRTRQRLGRLDVIAGTNYIGGLINVTATQHDPTAVYARVDTWLVSDPPRTDRQRIEPYDLAIVRLTTELPFNERIAPICLAPDEDHTFTDVTISGHGYRGINQTETDIMEKFSLTVRPDSECDREFTRTLGPQHVLRSHEMCMAVDGMSNCAGDSGGPAVFRRNGRFYQVGVVNRGYPCNGTKANATYHGAYTKVPYFLTWIRNFIGTASCT